MSDTITRPIPDVEYEGKVRAHDPETSWDAATQQNRTKTQRLRDELLALFATYGPMTDDELGAHRRESYQARLDEGDEHAFNATQQSIRSRRSELETAGKVRWTGTKRPSDNGSPSQVWELVE